MRGIASRLGVSATALYQHFESKDSILREIRLHGSRKLYEALEVANSISDPVERLYAYAERYILFARQHPWLYSVLMEHEELDWTELTDDEKRLMVGPLYLVRKALTEGNEKGIWRRDFEVLPASFQMWAAMHGLCSLLINGRLNERHPAFPMEDQGAFLNDFVKTLVNAFLQRPVMPTPAE